MDANYTESLLADDQKAHFRTFPNGTTICCLRAFDGAPRDALVRFEYLGKGAANVVFKIHRWEYDYTHAGTFLFLSVRDQKDGLAAAGIPSEMVANQVLRVARGRPKHLNCDDIVSGFEESVEPIFAPGILKALEIDETFEGAVKLRQAEIQLGDDFRKHLMDLKRVALFPGTLAYLASLTERNTVTMGRFKSEQFLALRNMGILLPDMSPVSGVSITLEIKPKWLIQSPSAPKDAVRCRTCAMQVAIPKGRENYICPLRLVHGSAADLSSWARDIVASQFGDVADVLRDPQKEQLVSSMVRRLIDYLTTGDGLLLLLHMQFLQGRLDPQGIIVQEQMQLRFVFDHNLRLAMTLRDCSLFILIPYAAESPITSKLGDLDFKSEKKFDDWREKEEMLLKGDMYTKTADGPDCWLLRV
ncbi:uncharacterized protein K460DRAFT_296773 [Cucurbitaria berberidis CBS 394.84]|uniref:Inositol-pentakisphosphate 2-kinase n=1 Tax=Cucurbitaria berberidis CBS 394.84 TaxID=1168544 RepID=A0A9P4G6S5_9PLEO|nr:uncharacterized protein K460DRAFT_296773 [Cucurbitaria berberidis CBS 394.84]KAF1840075.1 hypothetical protein K460DRAFT_296773 [Cucurbitaria berberidis CBS 394.84]